MTAGRRGSPAWLTPNDEFFVVYHFDAPALDAQTWRLGITGLVTSPQSLSLADLKRRSRREQTVALECSGDHGFPFFTGAVSNARWAGTPLAPILQRAGLKRTASEVVFYGADSTTLTIRDNPGVLRPGATGAVTPDENGQLDLTITEHFARSMSVEEALNPDNLLCYEMNGGAAARSARLPGTPDRTRLVRRRERQVADAHRARRAALRRPIHGARLRVDP